MAVEGGAGGEAAAAAGAARPAFREAPVCGLRTFWQLPSSQGEAPRALLFLAHGACHGAEDFFQEQGFGGLPEEHSIVAAALKRGYLVVAASSSDRRRKAWQPDVDGPRVAGAMQEVLRREGLRPDLPCFALGASNGGAFVLLLPCWAKLRAVICQIMAIPSELLAEVPEMPPALFLHMPRDQRTARGVRANVASLRAVGKVAEERQCEPMPIGPGFFRERCGLDAGVSQAMAGALRRAGLVDGEGLLLEDPRRSGWQMALEPFAQALGDPLTPNRSAISEVMNVAWGAHEITAEGIEEALDFCEREGLAS